MTTIPAVPVSSGGQTVQLPLLGLGTWPMRWQECADAVHSALDVGYSLIDTAAQYLNEEGVGQGIAQSGKPREEVIVTSKIAGRDQGYATQALQVSLAKLGLDHIDLMLIHWPNPGDEKYLETYRQLLDAQSRGLVKTVGVSNFLPEHLTRLHNETGVWPAVNQIQFCPQQTRADLLAFHAEHGIHTEGWRPFGEGLLDDPTVAEVASELDASPSQVLLRWQTQQGVTTIPKSASAQRQRDNIRSFDLTLSDDQIARLAGLDQGVPEDYNPLTHTEY